MDKSIEILKEAILLEKRGKAFYAMMAQQTDDEAVREFFEGMSEEESRHIQALSDQYKLYKEKGQFAPLKDACSGHVLDTSKILTKSFKDRIAVAGSEAAAVTAAILMEENAIRLYRDRADEAKDPNEEAMYAWLSDWEREHLEALRSLEQELRESIWHDNSFWPM